MPTFEESFYLARYPDVAAAVANGEFSSGLQHFEMFGQAEGRFPTAAAAAAAGESPLFINQLDFENFSDGDRPGTVTGSGFAINFSENAQVLVSSDEEGRKGNFRSGEVIGNNVIGYYNDDSIVLEILPDPGVTFVSGQLSFFYASPNVGHEIEIEDAAGVDLQIVPLPQTPGPGDGSDDFNPFVFFTLDIPGNVRFIELGSEATELGLDNIQLILQSTTPPPQPQPPVAVDDPRTTVIGTSVTIDVLANDSDPDNLTVIGFSGLANGTGTVVENGDGIFTYTPNPGVANVNDSFTYTIQDGQGLTATATVTLTVVGGSPPVAGNDSTVTTVDTAVEIDVLGNDLDADADAIAIVGFPGTTGNGGTVVLDNNGTPNDPTDDFLTYTPANGFAGTDSFTYTIGDGIDGTDTATVTVTVLVENDPPVATDDAATTSAGTAVTIAVLSNDFDIDGDTILLTSFAATSDNGGTVTLDDNGTPDDLSDDSLIYIPANNFLGVDSFSYSISDGLGGTDSATVTVTVEDAGLTGEWQYISSTSFTFVSGLGFFGDPAAFAAPLNIIQNGNEITITAFFLGSASSGTGVLDGDNITATLPIAGGTGELVGTISNSGLIISGTITFSDGQAGNSVAVVAFTMTSQLLSGGNDILHGDDEDNILTANLGNDFLAGFAGNDELDGGLGDDTLDGGDGNDTLTGGPGSDTFVLNRNGIDVITDFEVGVDILLISGAVFGLDFTLGTLDESQFILGTAATTADQRFIYDINTRTLFFDEDGNGAALQVELVIFNVDIQITAADLLVVESLTVPNRPPVALDDRATTNEDSIVTIDVLTNDFDLDGDPIFLIGFEGTSANGGTITLNDNSTTNDLTDDRLVYSPAAGFTGTDSFIYGISDGGGGTSTGTVTVTVDPVPTSDLLVTGSVSNSTPAEGETISYTIQVSGQSTASNISLLSLLPAGLELQYTTTTLGIYNQNTNIWTISSLPAGRTATLEITVQVGIGLTGVTLSNLVEVITPSGVDNQGTVEITIAGENTDPIATNDQVSTAPDTPVTIDVLINDFDLDDDTLAIAAVDDPANGAVAIVNDEVVYTPEANFSGIDSFIYTVSDGRGGTDTATVRVTVGTGNQDPTAVPDSAIASENQTTTIDVLANDSDPDGDAIALAAFQGQTTAGGTVVRNENGTPDNRRDDFLEYTPATDFTGTDSFAYRIRDARGGTDTARVTVNVTGTQGNQAPIAIDDFVSVTVNTDIDIFVLDNDTDPDGNALLITGVSQTNSGGTISIVSNALVYTPQLGFVGTDSFSYTVSDGQGGTDTATVTVNVTGTANQPPIAIDDFVTGTVNTDISIFVLDNDTPDRNALSVIGVPSQTNSGGTISIVSNDLVYTPQFGFVGTDSFSYTIADSFDATASATVTVEVTGTTNQPPIANDDFVTGTANPDITIFVLSNDSDPDFDLLSISGFTNFTASGGFVSQSGDALVYTPAFGFVGTDSFSYTIADGFGETASAQVTVQVTQPNQPPIAIDDFASTTDGTAVSIFVLNNDFDLDGDLLSITGFTTSTVSGGTLSISGNSLVYQPQFGFIGTENFNYTISDGQGGTDTATVTVTVTASQNQPPIAIDDFAETTEGIAVSISVLSNDFDPDGNPLSIADFSTSTVSGGLVSISGNNLVYQPQFGFIGTENFNYTISDGQGGTDTATVSVTTVARNGSISGETFLDANVNGIKDEGESGLATVTVFLDTNNNGSFDVGEPDALTSSTGGYFFPNLLPGTYNVRQVEQQGFALTSVNPVTVTLVQGEDRTDVNFGNQSGAVSSDITPGDDFATTDAGSSVAVAVLANDFDLEGDDLTIIDFSQFTVNGGAVSIDENSTPFDLTDDLLVYSPGGFVGTDSFRYTVSDQKSNATATVTVTVQATTVADLNVVGTAIDDNLVAGAGNDSLTGGLGNDTLTGGAGSDLFIFNSPTEGVDTIVDFDAFGGDAIGVSAGGFGGGLIPGTLNFTQFTLGTAATTLEQRFIYGNDGSLFFDADGTGAIAQVQIGSISGGPTGFSAFNIRVL